MSIGLTLYGLIEEKEGESSRETSLFQSPRFIEEDTDTDAQIKH